MSSYGTYHVHRFIFMRWPDQIDRQKHYVLNLSVRPSVRSSVCYQTCEHDIFDQLWDQEVKVKVTAENRVGGLAEASFSTPLGRVAFLVQFTF